MIEIVPSEHAREVLRGKTNNGILSHMHLISQRTTAVYIKRIHFMTYCCDLLKRLVRKRIRTFFVMMILGVGNILSSKTGNAQTR